MSQTERTGGGFGYVAGHHQRLAAAGGTEGKGGVGGMKILRFAWIMPLMGLAFVAGIIVQEGHPRPLTVDEWRRQIATRLTALEARVSALETTAGKGRQIPVYPASWEPCKKPVENAIDERIRVKFFRSRDKRAPNFIHWTVTPTIPVKYYPFDIYFYKGKERVHSAITIIENLPAGETIKDSWRSQALSSEVTRIILYSDDELRMPFQ